MDGHDRPHMLDNIHHPSVLHKCLSDFTNHMVNSVRSTSCAICDRNCKSMDCKLVAAKDLPHKDILKADDKLLACSAVRGTFFNYPGDNSFPKLLDGLVLERLGFESTSPYRMQVCKECLQSLLKERIPEAALANGLWLGDFPEHLRSATFVEMIAASPVRVSGMVLALDELKTGSVSGSAKSQMRGTFTFYMQDAYGVQLWLPACDTDIAGSFTCALVGCKPNLAQLRRLLGARRQMVQDLLDFQLDRDNRLVGQHTLARQAQLAPENLDGYSNDGSIPKAVLDAILPVKDSTKAYSNARSTHAHGNREDDPTPDGGLESTNDGPTAPFVIETNAVVDTGDDLAVAGACKPNRLRDVGRAMQTASGGPSLAQAAAAQAAVLAGRPSPLGTDNALVLTHSGRMVSDFKNAGLFAGAYFDLFPHGVGGHLDRRPRPLTLKKWAQILVRRRDARFRKSRTFLYCVCALIFRREAIENARWKLTGRISPADSRTLAAVTPEDLADAAAAMENGRGNGSVLSDRAGIAALIKTMESVHPGASWTPHNKRSTRMIAISYIMQMGQPLIWMTINPADINSPIVVKMCGVDIDVSSKLKVNFPDYVDKLRLVANDPVASVDFFHNTIDGVLSCLLRFGASDGDGGILGRVKGYVGMTEEQKRLVLHRHLLVWVFGYNDFASFRDLMDRTPARYTELAQYLDNIIFNQGATLADITRVMHGGLEGISTLPVGDTCQTDPNHRHAKECLPTAPPTNCFPRDGEDRCPVHDQAYARLMYLDLAGITPGANLHKCNATCTKYNHLNSCSADIRRLHSHINSFNPVIQFAIRSNMDLKVLLRESDAKGILFYILNYCTKTEQTLDILLPLLVPVVERIRDEADRVDDKELAVRLVRSYLCKQLSSLNIGGPAAASKVLDMPDHKISHHPVPCPMSPLLTWACSRDGPLDGDTSRPDDGSDSDTEDAMDSDVIITPFKGKLTVAQRAYLLYRNRCHPDDTGRVLHGMSYVFWHKLVRVVRYDPLDNRQPNLAQSSDASDTDSDCDTVQPGDPVSPSGRRASARTGRPRACRYDFVGEYKHKWQQVLREKPAMVNIMRDIPRKDTQPVAHCRLLLCMYIPFFTLDDIKTTGMLAQKLAAAEETAKREAQNASFTASPDKQQDNSDKAEVHLCDYGDDEPGRSVIPTSARRLQTEFFVNDALRSFLAAGFSGDDSLPDTAFPLRSGRTRQQTMEDASHIVLDTDVAASTLFVARQESSLQQKSTSCAASMADDAQPVSSPSYSTGTDCGPPVQPYLIRLRAASHEGLSDEARGERDARRVATNAAVAQTDVGRTSKLQHSVAVSIAQEFGLNRRQRLAFFIFANGLLAQSRPNPPEALRIYIGGGAGTGKSHVLKAIKAFIECPAIAAEVPRGRLLTVAYQGKQAASVGGTTVHSVCSTGSRDGGNLSGDHDDQSSLPDAKAMHWKGVSVLAMEEVSMVGCNLLVQLHKAACSMFPLHKAKPFGNRVVVMLGDFHQLSPVKAKSLACGAGVSTRRRDMTVTRRYGADLFRSANACVMLDESNRFTPIYAPIMERCLRSECISDDVDLINSHVMRTSRKADSLFDARVIAFRNKVNTVLTVPMMRQPMTYTWGTNDRAPPRSQGQTMPKIILDIRRPPGHAVDCAAVYVALSRATGLDDLNLLFPVTLQDLNQPQNPDIVAIVNYLHRLDEATMMIFLKDPGSFTPAYATLDDIGEAGPRPPNKQPKRIGRHGPGATGRVAHLIPNEGNNCFFNSALALALAAWDGQPLPDTTAGTPAAGSFFAALQLLRDSMFDECDLSPNIVLIQPRPTRDSKTSGP
ncbi:conserved unknown protein [Ectocarpus siliculosus]|uniref:ATP-dependent DNA helicase n=1 Tax=Ectocarpus siliculosus TaxID=2880 RepID=D7FSK0_ECTSI|nr:conserved unknown protein [Ectocarpus siliculosus]|eukprot:CBJ31141.1 conserved unknown protein [Ectocarpus siliculosus]